MEEEKSPIQPRLKDMKIGESISFPVYRANSVKNSCSYVNLIYERKFRTKICREDKTIKVTRIK